MHPSSSEGLRADADVCLDGQDRASEGNGACSSYFRLPKTDWQRRYEAVPAFFLDRFPAQAVAQRFGYKKGYGYLLWRLFSAGKLDFFELLPEGWDNLRARPGPS
jgi:hypothetical protein